jgi:hypothetical protein
LAPAAEWGNSDDKVEGATDQVLTASF